MEQNSFSQRLQVLIHDRNMTQKELAKRAEVTEAAMSHYIKGDRTPRSSVLARIAIALGTTSDYLMEGMPQNHSDELKFAKRLIARNVDQMSKAEKMEIMEILFGNED